ncbi:MAG: sigma 54-interacting transcriptional regulator, partial [Bacteroidota bacterium]
ELKDLFGFEFTSLVFYNDGEKNYLPWIVNPSPELENHKVFEKFQQVPQPLNASFFQELMHAQEIKSFNTDEIIQKYPEYPGIALYQKNDIKSVIIVPLSYAKNTLGLWLFNSKDPHLLDKLNLTLLENTASQLAIAVSSLLAREEIIRLNQQLNQEKQYLEEEININYNFGELVGESDEIKKVFKKIDQVSNTGTTVLITGETGTGKEVIARAIHNSSDRRNKPLVKLNCAALPPQLMESELFGHEKGSFTGATGRRVGKFELANKGTIFLDEIGEMPLELQAKLLRVLQEKEVERIGGNTVIKVDVRIITATNRNLEEEIAHNRFRSDLFYRLNVFPISIPPLRERKNDILPLVNHFIKIKSKRIGKNIGNIGSESLKQLSNYSWPGNIRELEHVIERGLILSKGNTLKISLGEETTFGIMNESNGNGSDFKQIAPFKIRTIADAERELIVNTLEYTEGRVRGDGGAAQLLGIKPTTLEARMKKLGIKKNISYQKLEN